MSDPEVLRANERYKAASGMLIQLGSALFAAAVVKAYVDGSVGWEVVLWLSAAIALIWLGWSVLGLLQSEAKDDPRSA